MTMRKRQNNLAGASLFFVLGGIIIYGEEGIAHHFVLLLLDLHLLGIKLLGVLCTWNDY